MASYTYQISSGSATATTDLGTIAFGQRNDALAQINPTNLAYGMYSVDASGRIFVSGNVGVASISAVTAYQANVWGVTASAVTGVVSAQGMAAHGAATAGGPVRLGMQAAAIGAAAPTAGDASATNLYASRNGVPFVMAGDPNLKFREFELSAASGFFQMVTASAGQKIVVTEAGVVLGGNATANASFRMAILSASAATGINAVLTASAQTQDSVPVLAVSALPPGAGLIRGNGAGILATGVDGAPLAVSAGAPGGSRWRFWATYYTVPS